MMTSILRVNGEFHSPPHEHRVRQTVNDGQSLEPKTLVLSRLEEPVSLLGRIFGLDSMLAHEEQTKEDAPNASYNRKEAANLSRGYGSVATVDTGDG